MKDYKNILEGVVDIINNTEKSDIGFTNICTYIGEKCPELKESEDKKWRKWLIGHLDGYINQTDDKYAEVCKKAIAWLEKQGEETEEEKKIRADIANSIFTSHEDIKNRAIWLDYLGYKPIFKEEQKATDKVEPKFHEGDWIIRNAEGFKHNTYLVTEVKDCYVCKDLKGMCMTFTFNDVHKNFKLWTIQDAKDGDILVHSSFMFGDFIFIYNNTSILQAYCYYSNESNRFIIEDRGHYCPWNMQEVTPATKEQRDLLFSKMKEANYEWNGEKKELKKIEQNPAWGEEDEKMLNHIIGLLEGLPNLQNLLKSLKHRNTWKPSDEQMEVLEKVCNSVNSGYRSDILISLLDDLNKL